MKVPRKVQLNKQRDMDQEKHWMCLLKWYISIDPEGQELMDFYMQNVKHKCQV